MDKFLKGNYRVTRKRAAPGPDAPKAAKKKTAREEFEARALQKLGGSIAFVALKDGFVWRGDDKNKPG